MIFSVSKFFCYALGGSLFLYSALVPVKDMGRGIVKLLSGLSFFLMLMALALYLGEEWRPYSLWAYISCLAISAWSFCRGGTRGWVKALYGVFLLSIVIKQSSDGTELAFNLSSMALLGIVTYTMILGHWYLVNPRLKNTPLLRALSIFWPLWGIKLVATVASCFLLPRGDDSFTAMLIIMRILSGFVLVGGLSFMAQKLVKMYSIQSATGVFYVCVFFTFAGELSANYLYLQGVLW